MYIMHCAELLDTAIRADVSTIAARLRRELAAVLKADAMDVECVEIAPLPGGVKHKSNAPSVWMAARWRIHRFRKTLQWTEVLDVTSICTPHARVLARITLSTLHPSRILACKF